MARSVFTCSTCGATAAKWHGQCPSLLGLEHAGRGGGAREEPAAGGAKASPGRAMPLREVSAEEIARLGTGIKELDRVLGGGIVPGSVILLGGSPASASRR